MKIKNTLLVLAIAITTIGSGQATGGKMEKEPPNMELPEGYRPDAQWMKECIFTLTEEYMEVEIMATGLGTDEVWLPDPSAKPIEIGPVFKMWGGVFYNGEGENYVYGRMGANVYRIPKELTTWPEIKKEWEAVYAEERRLKEEKERGYKTLVKTEGVDIRVIETEEFKAMQAEKLKNSEINDMMKAQEKINQGAEEEIARTNELAEKIRQRSWKDRKPEEKVPGRIGVIFSQVWDGAHDRKTQGLLREVFAQNSYPGEITWIPTFPIKTYEEALDTWLEQDPEWAVIVSNDTVLTLGHGVHTEGTSFFGPRLLNDGDNTYDRAKILMERLQNREDLKIALLVYDSNQKATSPRDLMVPAEWFALPAKPLTRMAALYRDVLPKDDNVGWTGLGTIACPMGLSQGQVHDFGDKGFAIKTDHPGDAVREIKRLDKLEAMKKSPLD